MTQERKPVEVVAALFTDANPAQVGRDFAELLQPLVEESFVVEGATPEELDRKDPSFTYDIEVPSTAFDLGNITEQERQQG